jgi:L-fuconolactonase
MQGLIDSHVYFWDPQRLRYPWLEEVDALNRPYLPTDLPASGDGWQIERMVVVQAGTRGEAALDEVDWIFSLAKQDTRISGIVAFAPLADADGASAILEQLASRPLVRGVRRPILNEPAGFTAQPSFVVGVGLLAQYGYSFDLAASPHQLPEVIDLVGQCPDVWFALDNAGRPDLSDDLDTWRAQITALAAMGNVYCKVSGLVTGAKAAQWGPADLQPYVDHLLEAFGVQRLMYASDWPLMLLGTDYSRWASALLAATARLSDSEKQALFYDNARRFYRLGD